MEMKELIKKYWFVVIIGIALIIFVGVYISDLEKNKEYRVSDKIVDGKYVAFTVGDADVYADDLYTKLYENNGRNNAITTFRREILKKAYETTNEMLDKASGYAAGAIQQYGQDYVINAIKQNGYVNGVDDLTQYFIDIEKTNKLMKDYILEHNEYIDPYIEKNDPRVIYHILVKIADITSETDENGNEIYTANPTEEEKEKLDTILEALKTKDFEEVAKEYSDDGSSTKGGYIGVISKANESSYYPVFSKKSLELKNDEVSEVITSEAGYHIIWNKGNDKDSLLSDENFLNEIENSKPTVVVNSLLDTAKKFNIEIYDEDMKKLFEESLEQYKQIEKQNEETETENESEEAE